MIVATKKDQVPNTRQFKQEKEIKQILNNPISFYTISNQTKENIDAVEKEFLYRLGD